jgi:hypothetical protein
MLQALAAGPFFPSPGSGWEGRPKLTILIIIYQLLHFSLASTKTGRALRQTPLGGLGVTTSSLLQSPHQSNGDCGKD